MNYLLMNLEGILLDSNDLRVILAVFNIYIFQLKFNKQTVVTQ